MADGPSIKFPDGNVDIVDPDDIAPTYADIITELREVDGVSTSPSARSLLMERVTLDGRFAS